MNERPLRRSGRAALEEIAAQVARVVPEEQRGAVMVFPEPSTPNFGKQWVVSFERSAQGQITRIEITWPYDVVYVNEFAQWAQEMASQSREGLIQRTGFVPLDGGQAAASVGDPLALQWFRVGTEERMVARRLTFTRGRRGGWLETDRVGDLDMHPGAILRKLLGSMRSGIVAPTLTVTRTLKQEGNRVGFGVHP